MDSRRLITRPQLRRRQDPIDGSTTTADGAAAPTTTMATTTPAPGSTIATTTSAPAADTPTTTEAPLTTTPATTSAPPAATTTTTDAVPTTTEAVPSTTTTPATTGEPVPSTTTTNAQTSTTVDDNVPPGSTTTSTSAASTTAARSQSTFLVTYTSVITNQDGRLSTQTSVSSSSTPVPTAGVGSSSNTGRTWGIVGGVAGGVVLLIAIVFVVYRLTQRRFSNLDEADDNIKWPELLPGGQEVSAQTSTLNPLGTRRTDGAGVGDDGDEDEFGDDLKDARSASHYENGAGSGAGGVVGLVPNTFRHSTASQEYLVGASGARSPSQGFVNYDAAPHVYPPPAAAHTFSQFGSPAPSYHSGFGGAGPSDFYHQQLQHYDPSREELVGAERYSPLRGTTPPQDQFNDLAITGSPGITVGERPLSIQSASSMYGSAQSHARTDSNGYRGANEAVITGFSPLHGQTPVNGAMGMRNNGATSPSMSAHYYNGSRSPSPIGRQIPF
ncbi:hypothetical protein OIO90_003380 [Microbotryomycetes sp. JL221]|nr:hypothetical protein OIO90_003380 [Microbotryomycetes sp. JL221]